jgi:excisionase family DNA binding protein
MIDEFVSMNEAARRLGVSDFLLRRRVADGSLDAWLDPLDRRRRLLRREDIERLATHRPLAPRKEQTPMPAA